MQDALSYVQLLTQCSTVIGTQEWAQSRYLIYNCQIGDLNSIWCKTFLKNSIVINKTKQKKKNGERQKTKKYLSQSMEGILKFIGIQASIIGFESSSFR